MDHTRSTGSLIRIANLSSDIRALASLARENSLVDNLVYELPDRLRDKTLVRSLRQSHTNPIPISPPLESTCAFVWSRGTPGGGSVGKVLGASVITQLHEQRSNRKQRGARLRCRRSGRGPLRRSRRSAHPASAATLLAAADPRAGA